jgi:hypothetical protein
MRLERELELEMNCWVIDSGKFPLSLSIEVPIFYASFTHVARIGILLDEDLHIVCEVYMEVKRPFSIFWIDWVQISYMSTYMSIKLRQNSAIIGQVHGTTHLTLVIHHYRECGVPRSGPYWE